MGGVTPLVRHKKKDGAPTKQCTKILFFAITRHDYFWFLKQWRTFADKYKMMHTSWITFL